jgi:adenylate cyclase
MAIRWPAPCALSPTALVAGIVASVLAAIGMSALPAAPRTAMHERVLDTLLALAAAVHPGAGAAEPIVVVDIDARSLAAYGPWPWPRSRIAELVTAIGHAGAAAAAIDILFEGPDAKSPATLARRLGSEIGRPDLVAWADKLPDGDRRLGEALAAVPAALGFALDPVGAATLPGVPFLTRGTVALPLLWRTPGGIGPPAHLVDRAAGFGALALPGDEDGMVRRVPLLVGVGGRVQPGLAAEAVRLAAGASAYRLDGGAGTLDIGGIRLRVPPDAMLRLIPGIRTRSVAATISGVDLLRQQSGAPRLRRAIVLIGSSAPELGGLRATAGDPLTPSVMLHAAAVDQLLRGRVPLPVPHATVLSAALCLLATSAGLLSAIALRPARGALAVTSVVMLIAGAALVAAIADRLFDPVPSMILAVASFATASLVRGAETQLREARLRHRFSQHLAPAVVERIAASPSALKLRGEHREITSLFTDIEGFTAMTHRAQPEALVAVLDEYFEGVARIVIDHGGMIDKLVGDAVHALFNTPLDLADHPVKAVRCAIAIRGWTEAYRQTPRAVALGLGRTRIGVETGSAIVGDVGIRTKLDYTAYGDAVNAASRLEAANKLLGSSICIGPEAANHCPPDLLRASGTIRLRGFSEAVCTYEPRPADSDAAVAAPPGSEKVPEGDAS